MILAFVHLGTPIPEFLKENIRRTLRIFPNIDVGLITDFEPEIDGLELPASAKFRTFKWSRDNLSSEENEIIQNLRSDRNFRNGYWTFTIERLLALSSVFEESDQPVLHIESDILLLPNFPMSQFEQTSSHFIWGTARNYEDIAAIFFVSGKIDMMRFRSVAFECLANNSSHTDMSLLYEIRKSERLNVDILPTLLNTKNESINQNLGQASCKDSLNDFQGYFDVAPIGMWLTGIDPRNTYAFLIIRDYEHLQLSGYFSSFPRDIQLHLDNNGNLWNRDKPIFNLHIHSKQVSLFGDDWYKSLEKFVLKSQVAGREIHGFYLLLFLKLVKDNFRNKSLFPYIKSLLKWVWHQLAGVRK